MTTIPMLEKELKEAYRDLKYYKNYSERLRNKLQEKENIIKEVREFIYKCNDGKQGINYSGCSKLLDILDKGE